MKRSYVLLGFCIWVMFIAKAQIVTTNPAFPIEGKAVTLIFDAAQGTAGLKGYTDIRVSLQIRVKKNLTGDMLRIGM